jgi:S-(hydroxymethyl)glutathione dehydrogenase / alcohol dehydrogenase
MRALVYHGPWMSKYPEDAILRITTTAICGSDLHLYHGTIPGMQPRQTLGHEFLRIIEVGL